MTTPQKLRQKFWTALADSPFLFLQRDDDPQTAVPMTAQLDKDADHVLWFFTHRDHPLARLGPVTATFAGKGHDLFARFTGTLSEETDRDRLDRQWSKAVEAWFDGKDDPELLMLRMDLGRAELWDANLGFVDETKLMMGFDASEEARKSHLETTL